MWPLSIRLVINFLYAFLILDSDVKPSYVSNSLWPSSFLAIVSLFCLPHVAAEE
jgi:hypothetical protein